MDNPSTTVDEARAIVRLAAEPWQIGDSVKAAIGRAARRLGMEHRRVRQAWYGEPAAWRAHELDGMRARARDLLAQRQARLKAELEALARDITEAGA
jgi:hypothetical protein